MRSLVCMVSLLALEACSPGEGSVGSSGGNGGMQSSSGGDTSIAGGSTDGLMDCTEDSTATLDSRHCLLTVTGRALSEAGDPIPEELASVCGPVCYRGDTDDEGAFTIEVNRYVDIDDFSISIHGRPLRAVYYAQLAEPGENGALDVGDQVSIDLPEAGAAFDRTGASDQRLESGGVELFVPEGVEIKLDPEDILLGDEGSQFRARLVPDDHYSSLGVADEGFVALYALGPFEAWFREADSSDQVGGQLSFPNPDLEPGAAVELVALGSYIYPDWVAPARFEVVATAHVSDDGERVELDGGEGVDYLTWIGLRPAE